MKTLKIFAIAFVASLSLSMISCSQEAKTKKSYEKIEQFTAKDSLTEEEADQAADAFADWSQNVLQEMQEAADNSTSLAEFNSKLKQIEAKYPEVTNLAITLGQNQNGKFEKKSQEFALQVKEIIDGFGQKMINSNNQ